MIYAGTNGFVDDYPVSVLGRYEQELLSLHEVAQGRRHQPSSRRNGKLEGDLEKQLRDALTEFAKQFSVEEEEVRRHAEPQGHPQADRRRVKNTRKITRAMKLVAAAKLRRAQDAIIAARPYSQAIANVVSELSGVAGKDAHALFEERELKRVAIIVITSDRGLAGAFNTNVIKAVERYAANELSGATEVSLRIIGKKANQHFSRRNARIASYDPAPTGANALAVARETANRVDRRLHRRQGRPRLLASTSSRRRQPARAA